jgi:hypothetical protein
MIGDSSQLFATAFTWQQLLLVTWGQFSKNDINGVVYRYYLLSGITG